MDRNQKKLEFSGLRYFDSVVSSVACFAGGHRTMYQTHGCRDRKRHLHVMSHDAGESALIKS